MLHYYRQERGANKAISKKTYKSKYLSQIKRDSTQTEKKSLHIAKSGRQACASKEGNNQHHDYFLAAQ
ncbi:hypothetical protein VU13_00995 [Desulfobulbus sp. US5]|nr:hypothetical protein [Desulfobulbus sp. US5]